MARLDSPSNPHEFIFIGIRVLSSRGAVPLSALFTLCLAGVAIADTHYVSKSGSNTYPYTSWETATDSISLAVEAADNWDTVRVGDGTFYEHSVWLKTGTTLIGAGVESTTVISTQPGAIVTNLFVMGDSSQIQGFYMVGNGVDRAVLFTDGNTGSMRANRLRGFYSGVDAGLISFKDPNGLVVVEENTFELCVYPAVVSSGHAEIRSNRIYPPYSLPAIVCGGAIVIVEENVIGGSPPELSRAERMAFYGTEGELVVHQSIYLDFCSNFLVRNNLMWGGSTGIFINYDSQAEPLLPWGTVENNTCYGLRAEGIKCTRNNVLVRNNLVAGAGRLAPVMSTSLDSVRFEYNLIWDYDVPPDWDMNLVHDNLFFDPMFIDTVDFKLQMFSPAIDAGDPIVLDTDGSRSDIGAYGGPSGESYSYLDLPPKSPSNLAGARSDSVVDLVWHANSEADLSDYRIYRDTVTIAGAAPALLLATVTRPDTAYVDTSIITGKDYFYRIEAADSQGNLSALSDELFFASTAVNDIGDHAKPIGVVLHPNFPNPFNAGTRVRFSLEGASGSAAQLDLSIYDILGRRIRVLRSGILTSGQYSVQWDGRDDAGHALASGVYFIRLKSKEVRLIQKALLLR